MSADGPTAHFVDGDIGWFHCVDVPSAQLYPPGVQIVRAASVEDAEAWQLYQMVAGPFAATLQPGEPLFLLGQHDQFLALDEDGQTLRVAWNCGTVAESTFEEVEEWAEETFFNEETGEEETRVVKVVDPARSGSEYTGSDASGSAYETETDDSDAEPERFVFGGGGLKPSKAASERGARCLRAL